MIDELYQAGTDAALDDAVRRQPAPPPPAPPGQFTGLLNSMQGQARAGSARMLAFGSELVSGYGSVVAAYPDAFGAPPQTEAQRKEAEAARAKLLQDGPTYTNEAGRAFRQSAADWMPDPLTTGRAAQAIGGFTGFAAEYATGGLFAGPFASLALGGSTGVSEARHLTEQGVDEATAAKAGVLTGLANTAMTAIPMAGATRLGAAVKGATVGVGGSVGQQAGVQTILRHAGYDKTAAQYDPFDPWLLAGGLLPGAIGFLTHGAAPPAKLASVKTEADVKAAVQLTPAEVAHERVFESSDANLAELRQAIVRQKDPALRAILESELATQTKAAGAVAADPSLVDAARVVQTAAAHDSHALVAPTDLAGLNEHAAAMERAHDQLANGEAVQVTDILSADRLSPERVLEAVDRAPRLRGADDEAHIGRLEPEAQVQLRDLYGQAEQAKPSFDSALAGIAGEIGGRPVTAPLKGAGRAVEKIRADYDGNPGRIKDLLRGTLEVDSAAGAQQAAQAITSRFKLAETGNRNFLDPAVKPVDGYRDAKFNVVLDNGHTAEIQVNVPEMLAAKKEAHGLYEERSAIERESAAAGFETPAQKARTAELNAQMRAIYEPAWERARQADSSARAGSTSLANRSSLSEPSSGLPLRRAEEGSNGRGGSESQATENGTSGASGDSETGIPSTSNNSALGPKGSSEAFTSKSLPEQAFERRISELETASPEMRVTGLDGEETSLRQALADIRREFAADEADAGLAQVAAECALRNG